MRVSLIHYFFVVISSAVILLSHFAASYPDRSCEWTFLSCKSESNIFLGRGRRCMVRIVKKRNGFVCQPREERKVRLSHRYLQYCSVPACTISPTWCPWSEWTETEADCGPKSGELRSTRQRCCHPVTHERINEYGICRSPIPKQTRRKTLDWYSKCTDSEEKDSNLVDPFVWTVAGVVAGVVVIASIITLVYCLTCRRPQNNRNRNGRRRGRPMMSEHRAVPTAPDPSQHTSRFLTERFGARQLTDDNSDQLPPSYEETQTNVNENAPASPPPKYHAALKLAI